MSQIRKISVPIRMGSKAFKVNYEYTYDNFELSGSQLLSIVMKKLHPKTPNTDLLIKTYSIYENVLGVERPVQKSENILNLLINQESLNSNVSFVIRKKAKMVKSTVKPNAKKCFKKLHSQKNLGQEVSIKKEEPIKNVYLKQILQNEIILNEQIGKLDTFDQIINNQGQDGESNSKSSFFRSIYSKLKKSHKHRSNLNQSKCYLIDSTGELSSSSSSPNTSSSKLDTLF
ncbi:unnamed protein product [Brachionus calyciflorus]|uniref:Uncharacterized protein n=1 Tax=Brachionus calyciflorus TaxID=104777 RepID=A0A814Q5M8_9BILA|nr:unnamed protein product [Brachionus calyciflorus]